VSRRRWSRAAALLAVTALGGAGCSVLLDWNDFTGGSGDGGTGDGSIADGGVDTGAVGDGGASEAATCGTAMQCTPSAPTGWSGPVALFVAPAAQGTPPACGAAYAATPAFDGNAGLGTTSATCSPCACGAVTGVTCSPPVMTFYVDTSCGSPAFGTQTLTTSCEPTTYIGASAVTVSGPTAGGGACTTTGGTATITAPAWTTVARACAPASAPSSSPSCAAGEVCAPAPASPFGSAQCVMQPGMATMCPAGYSTGPQVLYAGVDDQRGCTACQCTDPTGATCTLPSPAIDTECPSPSGGTLPAPATCSAFTPPDTVKLAASPTVADAGSCALADGGMPTGTATATGATSFCCTP
jgi:hypothetical protein